MIGQIGVNCAIISQIILKQGSNMSMDNHIRNYGLVASVVVFGRMEYTWNVPSNLLM